MSNLTSEEQEILAELQQEQQAQTQEQYEDDDVIQRNILAMLMTDNYFLTQSLSLVKPQFFVNEAHQLIAKVVFDYFDKYKKQPPKNYIRQMMTDIIKDKKPEIQQYYFVEFEVVFDFYVVGAEQKEFLLDRINNFAKAQGLKQAFKKCLDELKKNKNQDTWLKVHDTLRSALVIGRSEGIGLNYFMDFETRYANMAKSIENNEVFTSSFHQIDEAIVGGGLSRGELGSWMGLPGTGKTWIKNTKILMYDGTIKNVQDIRVGDLVMGDDSSPRKVLSTHRCFGPSYEIKPTKGDSYFVNGPHVLSLKNTLRKGGLKYKKDGTTNRRKNPCFAQHPSRVKDTNIYNISAEDWLEQSNHFKQKMKGWRVGVSWKKKILKIDPYFLGVWLGDGNVNSAGITTIDKPIIKEIYNEAKKRNLKIRKGIKSTTKAITYFITAGNGIGNGPDRNSLVNDLKYYNLINNKHIPQDYKINNRQNRLELLAGILDTDGYNSSNGYEFVNKNKQLAEDVVFLARSLGLAAYIKETTKKCQTGASGIYWRVFISGDCSVIPVRIKRKKCTSRKQIKDVLLTGIKVIPTGKEEEFFGFSTDGNHLLLLADFTVVHNSLALVSASMSNIHKGKKVLYVSLEMDENKIAERFDAQFTSLSGKKEITINNLLEHKEVVFQTLQKYLQEQEFEDHQLLVIKQFPAAGLDVAGLRAYLNEVKINGFTPDLLIVDYIGEMKDYPGVPTWESRNKITRDLRGLAVEENVCVLTAMQPDRRARDQSNEQKELGFIDDSNLADAYGQSRPLDALWSINQFQEEKECGVARIFVIKHRHGKSRFTFHVKFDYDTLSMTSISEANYEKILREHQHSKSAKVEAKEVIKKKHMEDQVDKIFKISDAGQHLKALQSTVEE